MILREHYLRAIQASIRLSPVVALLGPRQCGKTTLARQLVAEDSDHYFDLEDPAIRVLLENPMTALRELRGLVVIDEVQRVPELFPVLRVLADRSGTPATFLILGSASPELSRQASESLAGRVRLIEMRGFSGTEIPSSQWSSLWLRGGFPRSYLAEDDKESFKWRKDFIQTFLERDLANLGFGISSLAMGRFWAMISHYHGQIWNASEIAASMGVSASTARNYLEALEQTYMVRRLQPWYENLGKRLVKSPKIYFRDAGLFHALQNIETFKGLTTHPKLGASWEGFVLEELISAWSITDPCFHAVHGGSELDLFFIKDGKRIGVEVKRADAPRLTRSMTRVQKDLRLDEMLVIYPGTRVYELAEGIRTQPLELLLAGAKG